MKHFLKITHWEWVPGSQKEMIYKDDKGKLYIGPRHDVVDEKVYVVEISDGPLEGGYRRIVKFIN